MNLIDDINVLSAYWEITRNPRDYGIDIENYPKPVQKILEKDKIVMPKHMTHELFKKLLIRQCKKIEPEFIVDSHVESILNTITQYYREDPEFLRLNDGFSFKKSLLLKGATGTGKTLIMTSLSQLMKNLRFAHSINQEVIDYNKSFRLIQSYKIFQRFCEEGFTMINSMRIYYSVDLITNNICIDDLGSESIANHYGQTCNILEHIIMLRYDELNHQDKKGQLITHCTTNLSAKQLKEYYGERAFSRMKEMFNDIALMGNDRRK